MAFLNDIENAVSGGITNLRNVTAAIIGKIGARVKTDTDSLNKGFQNFSRPIEQYIAPMAQHALPELQSLVQRQMVAPITANTVQSIRSTTQTAQNNLYNGFETFKKPVERDLSWLNNNFKSFLQNQYRKPLSPIIPVSLNDVGNYANERIANYKQHPLEQMFDPKQFAPDPNYGGLPTQLGQTIQKIGSIAPPPDPYIPPILGGGLDELLATRGSQIVGHYFPLAVGQADDFFHLVKDELGNLKPMLEPAMNQAGHVKIPFGTEIEELRLDGSALLQKMAPEERLNWNLNSSKFLQQLGFNKSQIDRIPTPEAVSIIQKKITPKQWETLSGYQDAKIGQLYGAKSIPQAINEMKTTIANKVNIFDYLRTPENVLKKIGMEKESQMLRQGYDSYSKELPTEINRITEWSKQVPEESNQRIFKWLDGQKVLLDDQEMKVAGEIKDYLSGWADRLGLPKDKRITNYISHIFEDDGREFDEDLAKIIRDKVAGSVYDPFLEQRKGGGRYIEDTWMALDAYTKRAVRKVNLDKALEATSKAAEGLEDSQFKYIKSYVDRINLRPTDVDNLIDNFLKQTPIGYKYGARPLTAITQRARQMVYRGLLGLNPASALKNLSQGANTYAKLGEKYTAIGYANVAKNMPKFITGMETELNRVGVLGQDIIQDRNLSSTRKTMEQLDKGLFYMFNMAEKINRGAAYWGAKSKALASGKTEEQAIEIAKKLVRETQFTFGSIDTPLALSSDIMKTLGQFQSYTLKQGEFLAGMIKHKEFAGIIRYIAATFAFAASVGKAIGYSPLDAIPSVRIGVPPTMQLPVGVGEAVVKDEDNFGNKLSLKDRILNKDVVQGAMNYVPAGNQIRKTVQGLQANNEQGSYTKSGNLQYPIEPSINNLIFGKNNSPEAQSYYNSDGSPFGAKQTEQYKQLLESGMSPQEAYDRINNKRQEDKQFQESLKPSTNPLAEFFGSAVPAPSAQVTLSDDPLIRMAQLQQQEAEKNTRIKSIFSLGLSKDKTDQMLQKSGLGSYDQAKDIIVKGLPIEQKAEYIQNALSQVPPEQVEKAFNDLAAKGVMTTGVTSQWLKEGKINETQQKELNSKISVAKGKTPKTKKPKKVAMTHGRLPAVPKAKSIKVTKPKEIKPLKPFKPTKTKKFNYAQFTA